MSRQLPEGDELRWKICFLEGHDHGPLLPFFIEWGDDGHPCDRLLQAMYLQDFGLRCPEPAALEALLGALGLGQIPVARGQNELSAVLACPDRGEPWSMSSDPEIVS